MKIKRRGRNGESGQAIAETAAGLVAILCVFLGLLFISALGIENVQTLLLARGEADENAANGVISPDSGQSIIEWNYGTDNLQFTSDDTPVAGCNADGTSFSDELQDNTETLNLETSLSSCTYIPSSNNFAQGLATTDIFVNAASLSSHEETESNPIEKRGLGDLERAFRSLILDSGFTLSETVYMPRVGE